MQTLKQFEIVCKLGQGSYGQVYKVRKSGQTYVMKQINISKMDQRQKSKALNEVTILSKLDHLYIVKYFDSFVDRQMLCIVMEYCDQGDLNQYLRKHSPQPLPESTIWRFIIQMCLGLGHLHNNQILHRDIKTMNIFLSKDWQVRIGDLGVAKALPNKNDFAQSMVGTPYYLSPEMCEEKPYNEKSDVWALGCVLYELCTFKLPFEAKNQGALVLKIIRGRYDAISSDLYSQGLIDFVGQCLQKNYKTRPTVNELLQQQSLIQSAQSIQISLSMSQPNTLATNYQRNPPTQPQPEKPQPQKNTMGPFIVQGISSALQMVQKPQIDREARQAPQILRGQKKIAPQKQFTVLSHQKQTSQFITSNQKFQNLEENIIQQYPLEQQKEKQIIQAQSKTIQTRVQSAKPAQSQVIDFPVRKQSTSALFGVFRPKTQIKEKKKLKKNQKNKLQNTLPSTQIDPFDDYHTKIKLQKNDLVHEIKKQILPDLYQVNYQDFSQQDDIQVVFNHRKEQLDQFKTIISDDSQHTEDQDECQIYQEDQSSEERHENSTNEAEDQDNQDYQEQFDQNQEDEEDQDFQLVISDISMMKNSSFLLERNKKLLQVEQCKVEHIMTMQSHIRDCIRELGQNKYTEIIDFFRLKLNSDNDLNNQDEDDIDDVIQSKFINQKNPQIIYTIYKILHFENEVQTCDETIKQINIELQI